MKGFPLTCADPTKFFGCELGAQSKWVAKSSDSIVNGAHSAATLSDILKKFITM